MLYSLVEPPRGVNFAQYGDASALRHGFYVARYRQIFRASFAGVSLRDLKEAIFALKQVPIWAQRIVFCARVLADDVLITDLIPVSCESPIPDLRLIVCSPEKFSIKVQGFRGGTITISVRVSHLISELKGQIERELSIPIEDQHLFYVWRKLRDDETVGSYRIPRDFLVHLSVSGARMGGNGSEDEGLMEVGMHDLDSRTTRVVRVRPTDRIRTIDESLKWDWDEEGTRLMVWFCGVVLDPDASFERYSIGNGARNLNLLGNRPEELDGAHDEEIVRHVILICLSQPDEAAFHRIRNSKRGCIVRTPEILVVRLPIDLRPAFAIQSTGPNPRLQRGGSVALQGNVARHAAFSTGASAGLTKVPDPDFSRSIEPGLEVLYVLCRAAHSHRDSNLDSRPPLSKKLAHETSHPSSVPNSVDCGDSER
jgi:hypothetical protein